MPSSRFIFLFFCTPASPYHPTRLIIDGIRIAEDSPKQSEAIRNDKALQNAMLYMDRFSIFYVAFCPDRENFSQFMVIK
jgi:hypothetical protein